MARSELTIQISVKDLEAFRIAYAALHEIVDAEEESDDPDTRERAYGIGREIAEDALERIEQIGPVRW